MFAYCGNNPVMRVDPNVEGWILTSIIVAAVLAVCANIIVAVESNIRVATNDTPSMDDEKFNAINDEDYHNTSGLSAEEQLAYVQKVREVWEINNDPRLDEWSEAEMLRELQYHDHVYQLSTAIGLDKIDYESIGLEKYNLPERSKFVDYEEKQTLKTYALRFTFNLLAWYEFLDD